MSTQRYTPEFKEEAVRQIVDRGYSVADVSERLGFSVTSVPRPMSRPQNEAPGCSRYWGEVQRVWPGRR